MKDFIQFVVSEFRRLAREEQGLTMVEYAVVGGLIVAAGVTLFSGLGDAVKTKINALVTAIG